MNMYFEVVFDIVRRMDYKKKHDRSVPIRRYADRPYLESMDVEQFIYDKLVDNHPCMIARYGSTELSILAASLGYPQLPWRISLQNKVRKGNLGRYSGFFPQNDMKLTLKFCDLMKESTGYADYIGVWFLPMEEYIIKNYCSTQTMTGSLGDIEPWFPKKIRWTKALENKKVLVIHPFASTIKTQYEKRELLFDNPDVLPKFELYVVQAVQTIAGQSDSRFRTWFDALDYMFCEAMKIDFDIAIIGCGAYGFPLAARIKKAGKKAIHMGGAIQLLFGIKGARWDNHPTISGMYNENWVRASEVEKPQCFNKVEGGCYW